MNFIGKKSRFENYITEEREKEVRSLYKSFSPMRYLYLLECTFLLSPYHCLITNSCMRVLVTSGHFSYCIALTMLTQLSEVNLQNVLTKYIVIAKMYFFQTERQEWCWEYWWTGWKVQKRSTVCQKARSKGDQVVEIIEAELLVLTIKYSLNELMFYFYYSHEFHNL